MKKQNKKQNKKLVQQRLAKKTYVFKKKTQKTKM